MSIQAYWPTEANVRDCILSEAERLSDKLLVAVHHPTKLISTEYGSQTPEVKTQQDLLERLLNTHDIIPLLGESGSGKSHLIRWLHAVAKTHPKAIEENWHIIRVPKNASLSQVLNIMLKGLEGEVFEQARERIGQVSNSLSEESTRDLLFTHINEALKSQPELLKKEGQSLQTEGKLTSEKRAQIRNQINFATELDRFFADPHIKEKFSGPKSVIINRVSRLIESKSYADILSDHFELSDRDFLFSSSDEISVHLGSKAKTAYANLQLESDESKRKMAAVVTNQAIERACKLMFNRLFRFSSGSFQDLFKEIRKHLLAENKTLVVLVEDLAAISAIDDVLIESLLEQDQDDGEQVLCRMKSVIAATDGLESYQSHRSTIWTRGTYEWRLPSDNDIRQFPQLTFTGDDVLDFCARYINAARHGLAGIAQFADETKVSEGIPAWNQELNDADQKILKEFGCSPNGISLFPYNRQAILKLAQKHVFSGGRHRFNPRVAIQHVLLAILRDHNKSFQKGEYPSAWFENLLSEFRHDETAQQILLNISNTEMAKRLVGFMSLYTDADTAKDNLAQISAGQAFVFSLDTSMFEEDATVESTGTITVIEASPTPVKSRKEIPTTPQKTETKTPPAQDPLKKRVEEWFAGIAQLDQGSSNQLRQGLYQMLEHHKGFADYSVDKSNKWGAQENKSLLEFTLKERSIINIGVPGSATNNSNKKVVNAFEASELSASLESLDLKRQMLAILRFAENNPTEKSKAGQAKGWGYPEGFEDYIHYQDFARKWVPSAMQTCLRVAKQSGVGPLEQQIALAKNLGVDLSAKPQRLSNLVFSSEHIRDKLADPINDRHKEVLDRWLQGWDSNRAKWLRTVLVGANNAIHPIDFQGAFKQVNEVSSSTSDLSPIIRELKTEAQLFAQYLDGTETKAQLTELLESLDLTYKQIPDEMRPKYHVQLATVRSRVKGLQKIVTSETPKSVLGLEVSNDPLKLLHKISGQELKKWKEVLEDWQAISPPVIKMIQKFNHENGSTKVEQYKQAINGRLTVLDASLAALGEQNES
ncbi:protein DpdH [Shewanella sp. 3_MG-2023]|uniref:protein DpdH n=1 Tax=Shewanella sp. 3_MG-2023 TaxID=3062635 RepID=UPI0026E268AE|nr:protein DpdH [Shewanella sp. 3_MG-2023]MDO6777383.1 protein DpdH [Shewanella sp. 3_MG-2023]